MVNEEHKYDLSDFLSFIKNYSENLKKNYDKISKIRCPNKIFQNKFTSFHPGLKIDKDSNLKLQTDIPPFEIHNYHLKRARYDTFQLGVFIKITKYRVDDYNNSGLELSFDVVNRLSGIIESNEKKTPKRKNHNQLINSSKGIENISFDEHFFDVISFESFINKVKVKNYYYSDQIWDDRLIYKNVLQIPLIALPDIQAGIDYNQCNYNPNKKFNPDSIPQIISDENMLNREYEVSKDFGDIYSNLILLPLEDDIISKFTNTKLLHFLKSKELPILASITSNSLKRPIKSHEIHYFNEISRALLELHSNYPNCITNFANETILYFVSIMHKFKIIGICIFCGNLFKYRHKKLYCSQKVDGKDCLKKSYNDKYYIKNREKISNYYREEMRKTRELLNSFKK